MGGVSGAGGPSGTGYMARAATPPKQSHVYQPTYGNYTSPMNQAVYGVARGLGATPQYTQFQAQMPTYSRPQMAPPPLSGGFGRFPMQAISSSPSRGGMFGNAPAAVDPNLSAINQAFAPRQAQYDSDGNSYNAPVYMDQSQRNAILANPGKYLEYAQYVKGGGNPSQFAYSQRPVQYMTQGQREALTKSQTNQLNSLLPQAAPTSSDGS